MIGKTGTGKSSLCNAFLLGDYTVKEELFMTGADIHASTNLTNSIIGKLFEDEGDVIICDTPGLMENEAADANHIVKMIKYLKNEVKYVSLFCFTVNG